MDERSGPARHRDEWGRLHHEEGPAVIHPDGRVEFWLHGEQFDEHDYRQATDWYGQIPQVTG